MELSLGQLFSLPSLITWSSAKGDIFQLVIWLSVTISAGKQDMNNKDKYIFRALFWFEMNSVFSLFILF